MNALKMRYLTESEFCQPSSKDDVYSFAASILKTARAQYLIAH
jgi:hypothetical protein